MPIIPRGMWKPSLATPNEYHLVWFDPGQAATGWAFFVVDCHAFSRPEHKILPNVISWNCGEFTGPENDQLEMAERLIYTAHYAGQFRARCEIGTEDFQLSQTMGGRELLSPVRLNAAIDYICYKQQLQLQYQNRAMRTQHTPAKLNAYGFTGKWRDSGKGKDEFAAMQHAVMWLKRIKSKSVGHPWKLSDGIVANAFWDCSCARLRLGRVVKHTLIHP